MIYTIYEENNRRKFDTLHFTSSEDQEDGFWQIFEDHPNAVAAIIDSDGDVVMAKCTLYDLTLMQVFELAKRYEGRAISFEFYDKYITIRYNEGSIEELDQEAGWIEADFDSTFEIEYVRDIQLH